MKIAYILPSLANRGPIIFTKYLLEELEKKDVQTEIFYFNKTKSNLLDLNVKCTRISKFKKFDFSNFDIVHTTMALPDLYASIFVPKNKWVCSMHNYLVEDVKMSHSKLKTSFIIWVWKNAIRKCKDIIVSSNQMRSYYKNLLKTKKIRYSVISYGIYEKQYSKVEKNDLPKILEFKSKGYKIIGSVGLLIPRKGFSQLLPLVEENKNLALIIIGEGVDRKNLEKEIYQRNIEDRVLIPGFRNNSFNYYQYFDIYAHVSYSEGFGLAMLEAMSKGLPIICSNLEIYKDYFTEKDVSFFEPGNKESLFSAYQKINKNLEFYKKASFRLFRSLFDVKIMAEKHIKLYNDIIDKLSNITRDLQEK